MIRKLLPYMNLTINGYFNFLLLFFPSCSAMNTKLPQITKQDQLNREAELYQKQKLGNYRSERHLGSFFIVN